MSVLAQTTAGFPPASRADSAREISRGQDTKSAANGHVLSPVQVLDEPPVLGHPAQIPRARMTVPDPQLRLGGASFDEEQKAAMSEAAASRQPGGVLLAAAR